MGYRYGSKKYCKKIDHNVEKLRKSAKILRKAVEQDDPNPIGKTMLGILDLLVELEQIVKDEIKSQDDSDNRKLKIANRK